ncbi:MAG: alcohol dehydrogenase catalytic domain-containing protein [Chloroflexi bacterium]|nr:alcohol dehydrogenase catalytic domain-containing protein [Chloroflexota bacterium]
MKAIWIDSLGGPEVMQVIDMPIPEPGRKEVRIKVESVGLNYSDIMICEGRYLQRTELPQVLGREQAGVVDAVGPEVTRVQPGQRVYATSASGALAEYRIAHQGAVFPLPDAMTSDLAVALIVQGLTALHCLDHHGRLNAGETVLIHAAGGVRHAGDPDGAAFRRREDHRHGIIRGEAGGDSGAWARRQSTTPSRTGPIKCWR